MRVHHVPSGCIGASSNPRHRFPAGRGCSTLPPMPSLSQSKRIRALKRRRERRARGEFLLEGPRALFELIEAGTPVELVLYTEEAVTQPAGPTLLERLEARGVPHELVSERELARHADTVTPQGWIAVAPVPRWDWAELDGGHVLVLDGLQDPGNVGTLIRTAEALGAAGVVALSGTSDPWGPKATRAAAGSSVRLPVLECEWGEAREKLRSAGTSIWVATAEGESVERGAGPSAPVALVLGNEGSGVSDLVRRDADRLVAIEMSGRVESLNVGVAGALLMDRVFGG
jgi:TrmH family RNA methyltransferase